MTATHALPMNDATGTDIRAGRSLARIAGAIRGTKHPCVLCFKVPLERDEVEYLLSLPEVASVILASCDQELVDRFPSRVGYYMADGADWRLPSAIGRELIYTGPWSEFGARAALSAWRSGFWGVRAVSGFGVRKRRLIAAVAFEKTLRSLLYRLRQFSPVRRIASAILRRSPGLAFRVEQQFYERKLRRLSNGQMPAIAPACHPGRIVVVGASLGPGGAERQLTATLLGLVAQGHRDVHFLHHWPMTKPNDFYLPPLIDAGIPFSQVGANDVLAERGATENALAGQLNHMGDLGAEIFAYAKEFVDRRPEVVHVWQDQMNVVAGLAALLAGVPRIFLSCRSLSPTHFAFIQPYMRPIYRFLADSPNVRFLNNSEAGAKDYMRWLGLNSMNVVVVRNGFDLEHLPLPKKRAQLRDEYRERLGIPRDAFVVGVIMRISEEKRPLLWMQIAERLARRMPDVHFLVVGDGPMRAKTEAIARDILPGRAHFPGHERNAVMALAAMDLFLLTSRVEGLPNVLIEAQAVGVPPVAIDVGGAGEALIDEETGWLMRTSNADAIAEKILSLLADRERLANVSRNGPDFVARHFGRARMIRETVAAYGVIGFAA
jgi:glycosyltransferase involved in cell wall biosynthesis